MHDVNDLLHVKDGKKKCKDHLKLTQLHLLKCTFHSLYYCIAIKWMRRSVKLFLHRFLTFNTSLMWSVSFNATSFLSLNLSL